MGVGIITEFFFLVKFKPAHLRKLSVHMETLKMRPVQWSVIIRTVLVYFIIITGLVHGNNV